MTRFLRVGFLRDEIDRIVELCSGLREEPEVRANPRIESTLNEIAGLAEKMRGFMDSFSSEPLIWTGRGGTEEVISMLETLVSAAESAGRFFENSEKSWKA